MDIQYCDIYHPYRYLGEINQERNALTYKMMDFKNSDCEKHDDAVCFFTSMVIDFIGGDDFSDFISSPFKVAVVPSHEKGRVSPALISIATAICEEYENGSFEQSLERHKTVPSAHRENGDRSIESHMNSISVVDGADIWCDSILLIDDVTTTGGSMQACSNILIEGGAFLTRGLAILQTANYDR